MLLLLWWSLLFAALAGQCAAQNESSTTLVPITPFPGIANSTTAAPTLALSRAPLPAPTVATVTSQDKVTAWYLLQFRLESDDPDAGILNESQALLFTVGMESLTPEYAPEDWEKVVALCQLRRQELVLLEQIGRAHV